jgi:hypothetical protein
MNYWLDLFTGTTWDQFRKAGANTSGFRARQRKKGQRIKPGDVFLCYLTGVMRWIGALEVVGPSNDKRPIWEADFPVRFTVKPLIMLEPEHGVPMAELEGRVSFYATSQHKGGFLGFLRGSPNLFRKLSDAEFILSLLREAQQNPISRPVDPKKLARKPLFKVQTEKGAEQDSRLVSIPEADEQPTRQHDETTETATTRHTEMQYQLLALGAELGLDVWVARNDRGKKWNGTSLGNLPRMVEKLPTQFNEATTRTIELIDVLWLSGNSIVAAFEVEATTAIYSGLLRMSDLMSLQPNLDINLFLVAGDDRRDKVEQELLRPTFALRDKPLAKICGFLSFKVLAEQVAGIRRLGLAPNLKPTFLKSIAEYFDDEDSAEEKSTAAKM